MSNNQCYLCSDSLSKCLMCLTSTICDQCLDGYYVHPNSYNCTSCPMFGCLSCVNSGYCTSCQLGFYITGNIFLLWKGISVRGVERVLRGVRYVMIRLSVLRVIMTTFWILSIMCAKTARQWLPTASSAPTPQTAFSAQPATSSHSANAPHALSHASAARTRPKTAANASRVTIYQATHASPAQSTVSAATTPNTVSNASIQCTKRPTEPVHHASIHALCAKTPHFVTVVTRGTTWAQEFATCVRQIVAPATPQATVLLVLLGTI